MRTVALVGKIGPAFGGTRLDSVGTVTMKFTPESWKRQRDIRDVNLDILFEAMRSNVIENYDYRRDTHGKFCMCHGCQTVAALYGEQYN